MGKVVVAKGYLILFAMPQPDPFALSLGFDANLEEKRTGFVPPSLPGTGAERSELPPAALPHPSEEPSSRADAPDHPEVSP
ncbi:hypothetical protein [Cnuella takakiae]|uniref:hypothetical protein n=1 Tax=Cnuella takakiae TaxID=1302690 RepID=UPI0011605BBE|nr:hypothetical protein [Cnuella takakiae]